MDIFQQAFRNSPVLQSVVRAADGKFIEVNNTFLAKLGFTREQVIGNSPLDLGFWVDPAAPLGFREELETKGFIRSREVRLHGPNGTILTALLSSQVVKIDGEAYFVSAGVDITERKEAEAKLRDSELRVRESEARFGTAFRACPVIMTVARLPEARYVEVNNAFAEYYGYDRTEALGRTSQELGLWVDEAARVKFFADLEKSRSLRNVECLLRSRHGHVYAMQLSADIIEINREPHLLAFALDVTQRKQAEAELQKSLEQERELSQLKTDFVALVSHEFRTPLEIIMSSTDNLQRYHERLAPDKREQLLGSINKSVRRMSGMMEEVLLLGKFDADSTDFHPAPLDLASLCQRVRDEMESATNRRCPISVTVDPNAAGARGDEAVLRHILSNLLSNAVKYSAPGNAVKLTLRREGPVAEFRIVDHGCGIPVADQPRIFQAFHRGSNARQVHGTGLGLLIVRRCVERHGGEIAFESVEGRGTTFTVRLPLFPVAGRDAKPRPVTKKKAKRSMRKK